MNVKNILVCVCMCVCVLQYVGLNIPVGFWNRTISVKRSLTHLTESTHRYNNVHCLYNADTHREQVFGVNIT